MQPTAYAAPREARIGSHIVEQGPPKKPQVSDPGPDLSILQKHASAHIGAHQERRRGSSDREPDDCHFGRSSRRRACAGGAWEDEEA